MSQLRQHFEEVGPGWRPLLESLDELFEDKLHDFADIKDIEVLQVKEKFGGLRVYLNHPRLPKEMSDKLHSYIMMAERMSFRMCEECGNPNVETRNQLEAQLGWRKTLCENHHAQRDARVKGL